MTTGVYDITVHVNRWLLTFELRSDLIAPPTQPPNNFTAGSHGSTADNLRQQGRPSVADRWAVDILLPIVKRQGQEFLLTLATFLFKRWRSFSRGT